MTHANLICCFLKPLFEQLGVKNSSELLVPKHGDALFNRLLEVGGIKDYNQNPEAFVQSLGQKTVSFLIFL
jgi:hypothetical protein